MGESLERLPLPLKVPDSTQLALGDFSKVNSGLTMRGMGTRAGEL